jgi:sugar/nucleoside kinase (ribokinase family)
MRYIRNTGGETRHHPSHAMTTDLFFIVNSGKKVRWFYTLEQAQAHIAILQEVMPQAAWLIMTGSDCNLLGIH